MPTPTTTSEPLYLVLRLHTSSLPWIPSPIPPAQRSEPPSAPLCAKINNPLPDLFKSIIEYDKFRFFNDTHRLTRGIARNVLDEICEKLSVNQLRSDLKYAWYSTRPQCNGHSCRGWNKSHLKARIDEQDDISVTIDLVYGKRLFSIIIDTVSRFSTPP